MEKRLPNQEKLQKTQKILFRIALCTFLVDIFLCYIFALKVEHWTPIVTKSLSSLTALSVLFFISSGILPRIEKGTKAVRNIAFAGLICGVLCGILALLIIWEVIPYSWSEITTRIDERNLLLVRNNKYLTFYGAAMLFMGFTALTCYLLSSVMSIKESSKAIKPLKIASNICLLYLWIYEIYMVAQCTETQLISLSKDVDNLMLQLAEFTCACYIITTTAVSIISRKNQKAEIDPDALVEKDVHYPPKTTK